MTMNHPPLSLLSLLSLTLLLPLSLSSATTPPPPDHQSHFAKRHPNLNTPRPQEQVELTRPLPFSSLTPSCTLQVLSHNFDNTIYLPPTNTTYSSPLNCTWSIAALHLSASSNGSQYDRIAAVWLAGVELLRTSTPQPTPDGIFWNVHKDITKYSSVLSQSNQTLSVMLQNIVNDVCTGFYRVNLTFLYYNEISAVSPALYQKSTPIIEENLRDEGLKLKQNSLELNDNPADLIIPISTMGDEGFWFKIERESDVVFQGIQIPLNTYRAVIEVYVSFHGDDEFWYSNPPDSYIEMNNLPTKRGHGAYREVVVKLDDRVVGSVVPFPVIFTGGINPLFWEPVVSIGAFDLPSYEIELTPFLGMLLDNKTHFFGLGVDGAISFWLLDANLHLWLDHKSERVQAAAVKYSDENDGVERESTFYQLDGKFEIEGERKSKFSGWVNSSAGNFTTYVTRKVEFENEIKFKKNGTEKEVEQEVKVKNEVRIETDMGHVISRSKVETKYPLKMTTTTLPGSAEGTFLMTTELEHSLKEEKSNGIIKNVLTNTQKSKGWMFVQDHDFLSGSATTVQSYSVQDGLGCYSRSVTASDGYITKDDTRFVCATPW